METIIHIGQHKTGTTSIQYYLQSNIESLKTQKIYFTDKILDLYSPNHTILNVYSLAKNRTSSTKDICIKSNGLEYLDFLDSHLPEEVGKIYNRAIQANCNRIIWSNEGLYLLNSIDEYQKLVDLFRPFSSKIIVVCCFRNKKSFLKSYKFQLETQNLPHSSDKDSYKYIETDTWLLDYDRKRSILPVVFDECLYFDYNPIDNIKQFGDLLGIKTENTMAWKANVTTRFQKMFPFLFRFYYRIKSENIQYKIKLKKILKHLLLGGR